MKVMFVDDEIMAIQHIKSLVNWEKYGFDIVAEAITSSEALVLFEKFRPYIVFMDIKMPYMDGLELSRRYLEIDPQTRIVLVSGYQDFEYARTAVSLGVSQYLLKHEVCAETLHKLLKDLRNDWLDMEKEFEIKKKGILLKLLSNQIVNKEQIESIGLCKNFNSFYIVMLAKWDLSYIEQNQIKKCYSDHTRKRKWPDGIYLELPDAPDITLIDMNDNAAIIISMRKMFSLNEVFALSNYWAGLVQKQVRDTCNQTISVIVSKPCNNWSGLSGIWTDLMDSQYNFFFSRRECIIALRENIVRNLKPFYDEHNKIHGAMHCLEAYDIKGLAHIVQEVLQYYVDGMDMAGFTRNYTWFVNLIDNFCEENGFNSLTPTLLIMGDNWYCASEALEGLLSELSSLNIEPNRSCFSHYSHEVIKYIQNHYAEDINMEILSEHIGINGEYLRQLFKKDTSKTILSYLTSLRVKKAMLLIDSGQFKVYEIAEMVGYNTSQYFSKVFYKETGLSPLEYQKRNRTQDTNQLGGDIEI